MTLNLILLPLLPEFWDYSQEPSHLVSCRSQTEPRALCMLRHQPINYAVFQAHTLIIFGNGFVVNNRSSRLGGK